MIPQSNNASDYSTAVHLAVADKDTFLKLTAAGTKHGEENRWQKAVVRIVELSDGIHWQFTYYDTKQAHTKNYDSSHLESAVDDLFSYQFSNYHVQSTTEDLHLRVTKKGKVLLTRGKPSASHETVNRQHNRTKDYPIPAIGAEALWKAVGIMGSDGKIKPTKRDKFTQVNEFIRLLEPSLRENEIVHHPLRLIDCGCGNAYLTFAAYYYLTEIRHLPVHCIGIDSNQTLIDHCNALKDELKWDNIDFRVSTIVDFIPEQTPDIVLSLHACDTATDEAIAQGVTWDSRVILAAPCCQHELRDQIQADIFLPVTRHGVLKQRTADILTDACRAQILRILGYKTDVVQFIDSAHTPKNLMIRANRSTGINIEKTIDEYKKLAAFWQIRPALERLLQARLEPLLNS